MRAVKSLFDLLPGAAMPPLPNLPEPARKEEDGTRLYTEEQVTVLLYRLLNSPTHVNDHVELNRMLARLGQFVDAEEGYMTRDRHHDLQFILIGLLSVRNELFGLPSNLPPV